MSPNDLAVQAIATTALPSCTYNNATAGVGATLTASSNGAFPAVDGYTAALNDALAINGQSTATQNGFYTLTTVGDGSTPWVLTRRSPDDANIWTNPFCVLNGTDYANTVWCSETISSNVGTDSINFAQQAAALNSLSDALNDSSNLVLGSKPTFTTGTDNTIVGDGASAGGDKFNNVVIGSNAAANSGSWNVAIGAGGTNCSAAGGVAVGYGATSGSEGVSIGYGANCGTGSINIGYGINAAHTNAIGIGGTPSGDNVAQIGNSSTTAVYFGAAGTILGTDLALAGNPITTTQSSADSSTKIATTAFVQTVVGAITAGLDSRPSCRVATTAALTATYSNGSSGVGATLTNSGTKSAISIDGVALSASDRVLVKNQATAAQNGIYTVTTVGSGSVNWVLTRAADFNSASNTGVVEGAFTVIEEGTTQFGTLWIETGEGPFTIGTTAITFTQLQVTNVNLTNGDILVGNASNIAAAVSMSGDVTITNAGVASIKSSVALAGSPTTTTQSAGDNSTKIATTAYVDRAAGSGIITVKQQALTASGTYTPSSGMVYCIAEVIAGGGGAGEGFGASVGGGGGGAGGYTRSRLTAAQVGASQTVTIGAGGAGAYTSGFTLVPGVAGGDSSIGTLVIAKGGAAGISANSTGAGGAGGVSGTGDIKFVGNGGNAGNTNGGNGGGGAFGGAGIGAPAPGAAIGGAGQNYGSGGGGGNGNSGGGASAGGAGSAGVVIITEYCT